MRAQLNITTAIEKKKKVNYDDRVFGTRLLSVMAQNNMQLYNIYNIHIYVYIIIYYLKSQRVFYFRFSAIFELPRAGKY